MLCENFSFLLKATLTAPSLFRQASSLRSLHIFTVCIVPKSLASAAHRTGETEAKRWESTRHLGAATILGPALRLRGRSSQESPVRNQKADRTLSSSHPWCASFLFKVNFKLFIFSVLRFLQIYFSPGGVRGQAEVCTHWDKHRYKSPL